MGNGWGMDGLDLGLSGAYYTLLFFFKRLPRQQSPIATKPLISSCMAHVLREYYRFYGMGRSYLIFFG